MMVPNYYISNHKAGRRLFSHPAFVLLEDLLHFFFQSVHGDQYMIQFLSFHLRSAFPWLYAIFLTSNLICLKSQIGKGEERQPIPEESLSLFPTNIDKQKTAKAVKPLRH